MAASEYKKIIAKTLRDSASKKFRSTDELADFIVSRMEMFDEMRELLVDQAVCVHTPEQPPSLVIPATTIPDRVETHKADLSERIMPKNTNYTDEEIIALKQRAFQSYQANLPPTIEVQLPGGDKPLVLNKSLQNSPGAFSFIKILYSAPGLPQPVDVSVNVTEGSPSVRELVETVKKSVLALYSARPRSVTTAPPPPMSSLEAQMSASSWGANTDANTSALDEAEWRKALSGPRMRIKDGIGG